MHSPYLLDFLFSNKTLMMMMMMTASEEPRMTACDMRRMVWLNNRPAPEERDRFILNTPSLPLRPLTNLERITLAHLRAKVAI